MVGSLKRLLNLLWLITQDDFGTFVGPNTAFGMFSALAGPVFVSQPSPAWDVLLRLPAVVLFNWSNLLIFDLANQRLPISAREDAANKPWRPVPSGLLTSDQMRRALVVLLPLVLLLNHGILGTGLETALLFALTWMYNDLGGGDDSWMLRNLIIAVAFGLYNLGSARVASGAEPSGLTADAAVWIINISAIILTTMHVQDLKDQKGDRLRGRMTAPHALGDGLARWTIAVPTGAWSLYCTIYWGEIALGAVINILGVWVMYRCLWLRGSAADRATWQLWACWTACLYALPCSYYHTTGLLIH